MRVGGRENKASRPQCVACGSWVLYCAACQSIYRRGEHTYCPRPGCEGREYPLSCYTCGLPVTEDDGPDLAAGTAAAESPSSLA